jgi:DNA-binding NarL/FixJ family response regulator
LAPKKGTHFKVTIFKAQGAPNRLLARLAPRERQILRLVSEGHSNKEIAFRLEIAEGTVKTRISSLLQSGFATNRAQLVRWIMMHPEAIEGRAVPLDLRIADDNSVMDALPEAA